MTEKSMVKLGPFFPPLWLLGAGALGAVLLCLYIGVGVLETEKLRGYLEETLKKHQKIVDAMPAMEQEFDNLTRQLGEARAQKEALELILKSLRTEESEVRKILAQRDSAISQRDEADKTRRLFQEQQQTLLKEKGQAEQDKLTLEKEIVRLRGEHEGLLASTKKARNELATLESRMQTQQKLNELALQEQKVLEGFSMQVNAALDEFTTSVDALLDAGKILSTQGTQMTREAAALAEARTAMQKEHGEAVRSFTETASVGAAAQKQAVEALREQAKTIAADAEAFARQIAGGQKAVSEIVTGVQGMQRNMASTDKAMQDMTHMATSLVQIRQTLDAAVRDVMERTQQLEKSIQELSQESAHLQENRASFDAARHSLDTATHDLTEKIRQLAHALQTLAPVPASTLEAGEGQNTPINTETTVPAEHVPAQEQN